MAMKMRALSILVLCGLLLGSYPVTWLYGADDDQGHFSDRDNLMSASIQFILVQIERERLDQLMDELNVETLDLIPLEKIGQCVRDKDGAQIVSQTRLAVVSGHEAKMTVIENDHREAKNSEEENVEQSHRDTEVSVAIKVEHRDGNKLATRFVYDRSVDVEESFMGETAEEEEGIEQRFSLSSGIVLQAGQMHVAGVHLNEDMATLLLIKAEVKD